MKKFNLGLILTICTIVLALVAFFMMFVASGNIAATLDGESEDLMENGFTGAQIAFGYSKSAYGVSVEILTFSFMGFLPYLLLILAVVVAVVSIFLPKYNKILKFVAAGLLLVAGILFFFLPHFVAGDTIKTSIEYAKSAGATISYPLKAGAIVSAICALLGCAVSVVDALGLVSKND